MSIPYTLQQLRFLQALTRENSFTQAAESLFMSQPALSKQIKILEEKLEIKLISRENQKISLTEAGNLLFQYSERILMLCEESCRALSDLKNGDRGILTVGASQTIGTYLMPRVLALFGQHYPQINLKVQVDSTRIIAKNIIDRNIDIAVVGGNIPDELKKNLEIENFIEDELILIIPKSHPFALNKRLVITTDSLYHLKFITLNSYSTTQRFINKILIENNIETKKFNIIMELNSIEAIKTAVGLGLGVAFVSNSVIEKEIKLKTIEIVRIENIKITRTLSIVANPECYKSKAFEFFYNDLCFLKKAYVTN